MSEAGAEEALRASANEQFRFGNYEEALQLYSRALEVAEALPATELVALYSNRAAAHLALRQYMEALADADRCILLCPSFIKAYGRKSSALVALGRPGPAEQTLLEGLKLDPSNTFLKSELRILRQEDGDQSPKRCMDGSDRHLRSLQSQEGLALTPFSMRTMLPNKTWHYVFLGDYDAFQREFKPRDMTLRATRLATPILAMVVLGAQRVMLAGSSNPAPFDANGGHERILQFLIDAGARVDARDGAGYTALHHTAGNYPTPNLAKLLIRAGADPNSQDRFGTTCMHHAVMARQLGTIKMLLKAGARADIKDNDGIDAMRLAKHFPEILALIVRSQNKTEPAPSTGPCASCGIEGATKKCLVCRSVFYCDKECQRAHWKQHKLQCGTNSSNDRSTQGNGAPAGGATTEAGSCPAADDAGATADGPCSSTTTATSHNEPAAAAATAAATGGSSNGSSIPKELRVRFTTELLDNHSRHPGLVNVAKTNEAIAQMLMTGRLPSHAELDATREGHAIPRRSPEELQAQLEKWRAEKKVLKLKVEVFPSSPEPSSGPLPTSTAHMLAYNEDRSLVALLDTTLNDGPLLGRHVRQHGIMGAQAYFYAYISSPPLPPGSPSTAKAIPVVAEPGDSSGGGGADVSGKAVKKARGDGSGELVVISDMLAAQPW